MKNKYSSLLLFTILSISTSFSQDKFSNDFEPIRKDLTSWDPIRGAWLASSLEAISRNEPIPDRTFPEDFTPSEMLRIAPVSSRDNINTIVQQRISTPDPDPQFQPQWARLNRVINSTSRCKPVSGRTYGDPHLVSFDGESYSFQTVGEFTLARSESGDFNIQARQKPQSESISLNTAVAMNVNGDRVCIYAEDHPDSRLESPVRINGSNVQIGSNTYYLPHGGTIRPSGNTYLVSWPSGETANIELRGSGSQRFLNMTVNVYPCSDRYYGLLGNANGRGDDDFDTRSARMPASFAFSTFGNDQLQRGSNEAEKEYLAFLARDFAREWRITQDISLFDYGFGENTLTFTDERFPRVHHTVGDLSNDQQVAARRVCEQNGVAAAEMKGCIFDQAYIGLPPSPRPVINDPTVGYRPPKLDKPVVNNNNNRPAPMVEKPIDPSIEKVQKGTIHPDLLKESNPEKPKVESPVKSEQPKEEIKTNPTEKPSTTPIEKPKPVLPKPTSNPVPKPTPAPKPSTPKPVIKPGKGL